MSWLREADAEPIPGYRLIEPIGAGGFGEVWKCVAPGGILKAIKFVYGNLNADDGDAMRAEQEQKALERVKGVRHPFVLSMDRIEVVGGELAIVMELADKSLHDLLVEWQERGQAGIPRGEVIRYLLDAAEGLDHLIEKHQLQHLDVKPRNLFLIGDRVKVADFGLVKNVERQSGVGLMGGLSPVYAAPETFTGKVSKHADQYSLAVVYCELLSGRRPFVGKNIRKLAMQHMTEPPDLTMIPENDRLVVNQALAKEPTKRYPSCAAFIRALAPSIVQTMVNIDLAVDDADVGRMPIVLSEEDLGPPTAKLPVAPPLTANVPMAELLEVDENDDTGPKTAQHNGILKYRLEYHASGAADSEDLWGDDGTDEPKSNVKSHPVSDYDREGEVDLGAPLDGPGIRPDVTATKISRGVLRPTMFVGLGAFGLRALTEIRCRLLDRFGDPGQIPAYRFIFLDSDPQTIDQASAGTPEVALTLGQTFPLPLQPVINYRRRMIDHLNVWLPREKLHAIPRSLQPQGSRALGRLAFVDNYPRLQSRLRREFQVATLPDSLDQSSMQTGLSRGKATPRVFVFGSACGGSGGMIPDLGFVVRRLLKQLNYSASTVTLHVYCGSPRDPSSSRLELANVYATLTEIDHFRQADVSYDAHFGPEGPHVTDAGSPFDSVYLVTAKERTPDAVRDAIAHLATYVTQDVSSLLGPALERNRKASANKKPAFRSFGTYTSWFPRGLLLRIAARRAVARLSDVWQSSVLPKAAELIEQLCAAALADPGLRWEALAAELNRLAPLANLGCPIEATDQYLEQIDKEAGSPAAAENPGAWSAKALERVRQWAGPGTGRELEAHWKKSQFYKAMTHASQQLGEQWDEYLAGQLRDLIRGPGHRLATAEAGARRVIQFCDQAIRVQWEAVERHYQGMKKLREELEVAQEACGGTVKAIFGRTNRVLRTFIDLLKRFARQRIVQDTLEAGVQFFMTLRGRFEDRVRDLGFARQRLKHLRQALMQPGGTARTSWPGSSEHGLTGLEIIDPFWESVQGTATVRIVLPAGVVDLDQSADQFVQSLLPEHWLALDEWLQSEVLAPLGDLHLAATVGADVAQYIGRPLVEQAAAHLGTILPITDVAQVEFSAAAATGEELERRIADYGAAAAPLIGETNKDDAYLLIPETEAGQAFARAAVMTRTDVSVVPIENPIELTVLRELPALPTNVLQEWLALARQVYQEVVGVPALSPHSRFDVTDWRPLGTSPSQ